MLLLNKTCLTSKIHSIDSRRNVLAEWLSKSAELAQIRIKHKEALIHFIENMNMPSSVAVKPNIEFPEDLKETDIDAANETFTKMFDNLREKNNEIYDMFKKLEQILEGQELTVAFLKLGMINDCKMDIEINDEKDFVSIFKSDMIDKIVDGMVPSFYALASRKEMFTSEGRNVNFSGSKVTNNNSRYNFLEIFAGIFFNDSSSLLNNRISQTNDGMTNTVKYLAEKMKNRRSGEKVYYTKSRLEYTKERFAMYSDGKLFEINSKIVII